MDTQPPPGRRGLQGWERGGGGGRLQGWGCGWLERVGALKEVSM